MKYRVIVQFVDLKDEGHLYNAGDAFPREGHKVSEDRIKELMGGENRRHMALIEAVPEKVPEKVVKDDSPKHSDNVKSKPGKKKQSK